MAGGSSQPPEPEPAGPPPLSVYVMMAVRAAQQAFDSAQARKAAAEAALRQAETDEMWAEAMLRELQRLQQRVNTLESEQ